MKQSDVSELAACIARILAEKDTPEPPPAPSLLTARDVAKRLQVNTQTVYRLAREGKLPAVQLGTRTHRWTEDTVNNFISSGGNIEKSNSLPAQSLRLAG